MSSSQHLVDDNNSCSIDISFFILSRHNPSILYFFIGIGNTLCSISAVTGNAIILLALRRCSLLHFSSKALFFSLALSDFAVGLVSQPLYAAYTFAVAWNNARLYCTVGLPHTLFTTFLGLASFWTQMVVALDRYLALSLLTRYRSTVSFKRVNLLIITGWFFSASLTASRFFSATFRRLSANMMLVICLLLSLFFYFKTYVKLRKQKLQMDSRSSFRISHYGKSLKTMFIVFCIFWGTYLPFLCALAAATASGFSSSPQLLAFDMTSVLALLNSSLNPVVYCWRIKEIRREAKLIIRRACPCNLAILQSVQGNQVVPFGGYTTTSYVSPVSQRFFQGAWS